MRHIKETRSDHPLICSIMHLFFFFIYCTLKVNKLLQMDFDLLHSFCVWQGILLDVGPLVWDFVWYVTALVVISTAAMCLPTKRLCCSSVPLHRITNGLNVIIELACTDLTHVAEQISDHFASLNPTFSRLCIPNDLFWSSCMRTVSQGDHYVNRNIKPISLFLL